MTRAPASRATFALPSSEPLSTTIARYRGGRAARSIGRACASFRHGKTTSIGSVTLRRYAVDSDRMPAECYETRTVGLRRPLAPSPFSEPTYHEAMTAPSSIPTVRDLRDRRVLVVEDDPTVREVASG